MANGFVVAKLHSQILHTSKIKTISLTSRRKYKTNSSSPASLKLLNKILDTSKIKTISLTSRRKYKTNSSSPASLKLLNKILGKTLQNTLGVEIILKRVQDYPCFTTKPFFTECTGRHHQKLGPYAPYSKFHFNDSATDRFKDNLGIEKSENESPHIKSEVQTIEYKKVRTKFQKAYFTKCIVHHHQKPDSNASDPTSDPLKDPATDPIDATYFSDENLAKEESESKPTPFDIGTKEQTIPYINKVKQAKFQKPYFTKCSGHYRYRPGSNSRFPLYSIPSKNPATDLTKAIYLSNKNNLMIKISKDNPTYFEIGSNIQTIECNKGKTKLQKAYFKKCIRHHQEKLHANISDPMYHIPLKDPATDQIEATCISDKDNLAMDKCEKKPAHIDIGFKAHRIEYNKVKVKIESPYFTKCNGYHVLKPESNAPDPMYPNPLMVPPTNRIESTYFSDKDIIAIEKYENKPADIDMGSKLQRIEYNKVKTKFQSPYSTNRTGHDHQCHGSNASEPMFSLYPIPSLTPYPERYKEIPFFDEDSLTKIKIKPVGIDIRSKVQRIEYNKVKAKYVENTKYVEKQKTDYGFNSVKRNYVVPKMPQPAQERSEMIESQLKYNKVRPIYPRDLDSDPKDEQST